MTVVPTKLVALDAVAMRLWARDAHEEAVRCAARWIAAWGPLPRGTAVTLHWDDSAASTEALWVATRLGLHVTVVTAVPLDDRLWAVMVDQSVTFGGRLAAATEAPTDTLCVHPAP